MEPNIEQIVNEVIKLVPFRHNGKRIGRNEKCPCESGKKFKKCCLLLKK